MAGRHQRAVTRRPPLRWLAGAAALAVSAAVLLAMGTANAATRNVKAQLALSGVATANSPAGGSVIGIRPGDSVTFSAAGVPTVGLTKLGLGNLVGPVDNLLGGAATFQVRADFSALPGGARDTVLSGKKSITFHFRNTHTYNFTWTVEKVTVVQGVLGGTHKQVSTIQLDANQLRQAGVRLNAANQYVGQVVVKKNPPSGGVSVQLPSVHVAPSITGAGQLPTVGVPGVNPPTLSGSVPGGLPSLPNPLQSSGGSHHAGSHHGSPGVGYTPPATTVPQEVVPQGQNAAIIPGGNYGTGERPGTAARVIDVPPIPRTHNAVGSNSQGSPGSKPSGRSPKKTVDLATDAQNPSGELPVLLAIVAVIALALVAGAYARLLLNRRKL